MKNSLITYLAVAFLWAQAGMVLAANPDTGPGCGLGKLAWADFKNQKNIAPQVLMATTNATGMNTFGISSGTSGCTNDGQVWAEHKTTVFASVNFENLTQDMAQGRGENLASLATLLGVPGEHQSEFFALAQDKYATLTQGGEASPVALIKALNDAIAGHPVLARATIAR